MVDSNANINGFTNAMKSVWIPGSVRPKVNHHSAELPQAKVMSQKTDIADTSKDVDDIQQLSEISIKDLLSGKSEDIASVVSRMAKTDISFKAFAGIKNELIEAYRETMNSSL
jgi:flagellar hook-basal body complex protein FliE